MNGLGVRESMHPHETAGRVHGVEGQRVVGTPHPLTR